MTLSVRHQWFMAGAAVALIAGLMIAASVLLSDRAPAVGPGARAPEFTARQLDSAGAVRHLSDYSGRLVLLNVWATWCIPCRAEMPSIQQLHNEFGAKGLHVVAVSIDEPGQQDAIHSFAAELGLTFEILHDPTGQIVDTYQMPGVPETFVIAPDGVIRKTAFATNWYSDENRQLIRQLLASDD